mgnify:CR=1 FL=1
MRSSVKLRLGTYVLFRFPRALLEVARASEFGFEKYKADPVTYKTAYRQFDFGYDRGAAYRDKIVGHLVKEELEGPINHEDADLLHMAQVAWNALAAIEVYLASRDAAPKEVVGSIEPISADKLKLEAFSDADALSGPAGTYIGLDRSVQTSDSGASDPVERELDRIKRIQATRRKSTSY